MMSEVVPPKFMMPSDDRGTQSSARITNNLGVLLSGSLDGGCQPQTAIPQQVSQKTFIESVAGLIQDYSSSSSEPCSGGSGVGVTIPRFMFPNSQPKSSLMSTRSLDAFGQQQFIEESNVSVDYGAASNAACRNASSPVSNGPPSNVGGSDYVVWARFEPLTDVNDQKLLSEEAEVQGCNPPLLLILGYSSSVQLWSIPPFGEAKELCVYAHSSNVCVRILKILSTPHSQSDLECDEFRKFRPLMVTVESTSSSSIVKPNEASCHNNTRGHVGGPSSRNTASSASAKFGSNIAKFTSLKNSEQVHSIEFGSEITDITCNRRVIIFCFVGKLAVFNATNLQSRYSITSCYPLLTTNAATYLAPYPSSASSNRGHGNGSSSFTDLASSVASSDSSEQHHGVTASGPVSSAVVCGSGIGGCNPIALGDRWLAYADDKLYPTHRSLKGLELDYSDISQQSVTAWGINVGSKLAQGVSKIYNNLFTSTSTSSGSGASFEPSAGVVGYPSGPVNHQGAHQNMLYGSPTGSSPTLARASGHHGNIGNSERGRGVGGSGGGSLTKGVVTIVDIEATYEDRNNRTTSASSMRKPLVIAHFLAHYKAIVALQFDSTGSLLLTCDKHGTHFNLFRILPSSRSLSGQTGSGSTSGLNSFSSLTTVQHLYSLYRGDTYATVQDISFSPDSRWVTVSTMRGTTHIFPITPYGGPIGVRTHTPPRIMNRLSKFHRSAGISQSSSQNSGGSNTSSSLLSCSPPSLLQSNIPTQSANQSASYGTHASPLNVDSVRASSPFLTDLCSSVGSSCPPPAPSVQVVQPLAQLRQPYLYSLTSQALVSAASVSASACSNTTNPSGSYFGNPSSLGSPLGSNRWSGVASVGGGQIPTNYGGNNREMNSTMDMLSAHHQNHPFQQFHHNIQQQQHHDTAFDDTREMSRYNQQGVAIPSSVYQSSSSISTCPPHDLPVRLTTIFAPHRATQQLGTASIQQSTHHRKAGGGGLNKSGISPWALYVLSSNGSLLEYSLQVHPDSALPKERVSESSAIELNVTPSGQWDLSPPPINLHRASTVSNGGLSIDNPLLLPSLQQSYVVGGGCGNGFWSDRAREAAPGKVVESEDWLPQVEISTHVGPSRRLWMGPQFTFNTVQIPSDDLSSSPNDQIKPLIKPILDAVSPLSSMNSITSNKSTRNRSISLGDHLVASKGDKEQISSNPCNSENLIVSKSSKSGKCKGGTEDSLSICNPSMKQIECELIDAISDETSPHVPSEVSSEEPEVLASTSGGSRKDGVGCGSSVKSSSDSDKKSSKKSMEFEKHQDEDEFISSRKSKNCNKKSSKKLNNKKRNDSKSQPQLSIDTAAATTPHHIHLCEEDKDTILDKIERNLKIRRNFEDENKPEPEMNNTVFQEITNRDVDSDLLFSLTKNPAENPNEEIILKGIEEAELKYESPQEGEEEEGIVNDKDDTISLALLGGWGEGCASDEDEIINKEIDKLLFMTEDAVRSGVGVDNESNGPKKNDLKINDFSNLYSDKSSDNSDFNLSDDEIEEDSSRKHPRKSETTRKCSKINETESTESPAVSLATTTASSASADSSPNPRGGGGKGRGGKGGNKKGRKKR